MKNQYDISIAGIPIGGASRVTPETQAAFKRARIIFDLTSNRWPFKELRDRVVDLDKDYWTGEVDEDVYTRIADLVLDEGRKAPGVLLAVDGHPGIYQDLSWDILERGKRAGLKVRLMPALSCLDAMVALCGLQLGADGLQILEATTIVGFNVRVNPYVDLLLMQIGWFGTSLLTDIVQNKKRRFEPLVNYLLRYYPTDHPVKLLRVSYSIGEAPRVISTRLSRLDGFHKSISTDATLFVPRIEHNGRRPLNRKFLAQTVQLTHLADIADLPKDGSVVCYPAPRSGR